MWCGRRMGWISRVRRTKWTIHSETPVIIISTNTKHHFSSTFLKSVTFGMCTHARPFDARLLCVETMMTHSDNGDNLTADGNLRIWKYKLKSFRWFSVWRERDQEWNENCLFKLKLFGSIYEQAKVKIEIVMQFPCHSPLVSSSFSPRKT